MTEINTHPPGTFCWVDLATTDAGGAKKFYGELFDWRARQIPVGPGVFTMLQLGGKEIASLYQLSKQHQAQGVPAHWIPYVAVVNVDNTAERSGPLGAQILVEPFDVLDLGRMALMLDPTGVSFALWQAGRHIGSRLVNQAGTLVWCELITPDLAIASRFYTRLFGWNVQFGEMDQTARATFFNEDQKVAGMRLMNTTWGDSLPQWRVYFGVTNCEASAKIVKKLGGEVIAPPTNRVPGHRSVLVRDSQGAMFSFRE